MKVNMWTLKRLRTNILLPFFILVCIAAMPCALSAQLPAVTDTTESIVLMSDTTDAATDTVIGSGGMPVPGGSHSVSRTYHYDIDFSAADILEWLGIPSFLLRTVLPGILFILLPLLAGGWLMRNEERRRALSTLSPTDARNRMTWRNEVQWAMVFAVIGYVFGSTALSLVGWLILLWKHLRRAAVSAPKEEDEAQSH